MSESASAAPVEVEAARVRGAAPDRDERAAAPLPPWPVLAVAGAVGLLHALPFLAMRLSAAAPGQSWMGVPYIPKDWLAYLALVRQVPRQGELLLANPFTTEPQTGRFVLLLHQPLNAIHRLTGADPGWILEAARTALILAFAIVLWRFLADAIRSDRTRAWAVTLALCSGGFGFVALSLVEGSASPIASVVWHELWSMNGWTTYEALYNPLWVAGLVLLLLALGPLLRPGGPRSSREIAGTAAALVALWFTHPYSAIAVGVIVTAALGGEWLLTRTLELRRLARVAAATVPALAIVGLVIEWQLADPVYARAASGVFGPQNGPVFWYPVAFGLLGAFAIVGASEWIRAANPWRYAIGGWVVAIALLHSSPVLNGYHFLMYAMIPLAILAAGPVERVFAGIRARGTRAEAWGAAVAVLLVGNTVASAAQAVREVDQFQMPRAWEETVAALSALPPGNVLCDPDLGNVVPAYTQHRVWVGQWFMTPGFQARAAQVVAALESGDVPVLRQLVHEGGIDYLVAPPQVAAAVAGAMPELAPTVEPHGALAIVRVARAAPP